MEVYFELDYIEDQSLGKNPRNDLKLLLEQARLHIEGADEKLLERAFLFCVDKHAGSFRLSGLPYYTHPLNVALSLMKEFPIHDNSTIVSSLLHDIIEDKNIQKDTIAATFGSEITEIVDSVTKIKHSEITKIDTLKHTESIDIPGLATELKNKAATYRKLFLALVKDIRVIIIKLADRLHNLRTLSFQDLKKQKEIAIETLNFYTPLAHRLGLTRIKMELENRSFYHSDPSLYEVIRTELNWKRRDFIDYIQVFTDLIQNSLGEQGISHTLTIVHKHEYEIFKIMQEGKSIGDIDNFYSIVIILNSDDVSECYRAHGVLANAFNAVSFIDYIANPKMDWYKSLNTELFGPDGKRVEILIRTEEMEKIAEEGFAAIFSLKAGRTRALGFTDKEIEQWGSWMQDMIETKGEEAAQIIWDSIKVNLFDSELTCYSKSGKPVKLPKGASVIDFAFAISDDEGLHCISAKVNGIVKDLYYLLNTGDQVEIITSPNITPSLDWFDSVVSHKAVVRLNKFFQENPSAPSGSGAADENFEVKLRIRGIEREGLLQKIIKSIGKANIRRIVLDNSDELFQSAITLEVRNSEELNHLFASLLSIKGIKGVERLDPVE